MKPHHLRFVFTGFILLAAAGISGQTYAYVTDSQPGQGSCNTIPFKGDAEWRYQVLVTPAQLGSRPLRITDIAFAPCSSGTFTASQFEVRMAHCYSGKLSSYFDNNLSGNAVSVLQGPVTWPYTQNQWCALGLTTHFDFNARNSLVVEVRYRGGSGGDTFRRTSVLPRAYQFGVGSFGFAQARYLDTGGLKMRFTVKDIALTGSGAGAPGTAYTFALVSGADAGRSYQAGTSLGPGPIPLGPRRLHLSPDSLLVASTSNTLPGVFANYAGVLDGSGRGQAKIHLPKIAALKGHTLYTAFVVLDLKAPLGIQEISGTHSFMIL